MTLTIDLTPAEEARLAQMAAARGEDITQFATNILRAMLAAQETEQVSMA